MPQSEQRRSQLEADSPTTGHTAPHQAAPARRQERSWPVRALTFLLALQAILLVAVGLFNLQDGEDLMGLVLAHPFYVVFIPLGILALIATIGFLRPRPGAWVIAMMVQGLMLLMVLFRYFAGEPRDTVLYVMLFYGVVMVLYLNYAEVPLVFRVQPGETVEKEAEVGRQL